MECRNEKLAGSTKLSTNYITNLVDTFDQIEIVLSISEFLYGFECFKVTMISTRFIYIYIYRTL